MLPRASIVIPTYNQDPDSLARAIASTRAQTVPVEVIVVDDGSDVPVVGATTTHLSNRGISAALNSGIAAMTTDWFCWLPSDDTFLPRKVELQLMMLEARRGLAGYHAFRVDGSGKFFQPMNTLHQQKRILRAGCAINGGTVMLHRSVFDEVGLFDESYRFGQDWEFWCRVGWRMRWYGLDQILGDRYTDGNLTSRIMADSNLLAVKNAEDERIRATYLV